MSEQNGQDAGETLASSVEKSYAEAAKRAYERAKGDTDTSKEPPSAAPKPTGT